MDPEEFRLFIKSLPRVEETHQWGDNLVYWVGDKAVGGKMFAVLNLDEPTRESRELPLALSFSVGPERFHELLEQDGVLPAPYFARIFWIAFRDWRTFSTLELKELLKAAHTLTLNKMPKRVQDTLALPAAEYRKAVAAGRASARTKEAWKKKSSKTS